MNMFLKRLVLLVCVWTIPALLQAQKLSEPSIKVNTVSVDSFDTETLHLQFDLLVNNTNSMDINVKKLRYRFSLELQTILEGEIEKQISLPAKQESHLVFPLVVRVADVMDKVEKMADKDTLIYGIEGEITPSGLLSAFKIPFESAGYIPNPRLPDITVESCSVTGVSFTAVDLVVKMGIRNNNSFNFKVSQLEYDLAVNGRLLHHDILEQVAEVKARTFSEVELTASLDPANLLDSIDLLLGADPVKVSVSGWAHLDTPVGVIVVPITVEHELVIHNP
jgi:LEA14-like dessication related protein